MKNTPTKANWGKFTRWKHRFTAAGIETPREGDMEATLERMEREHPELTSIPDKKLAMRRAELKVKAEREEAEGEEETPEEEPVEEKGEGTEAEGEEETKKKGIKQPSGIKGVLKKEEVPQETPEEEKKEETRSEAKGNHPNPTEPIEQEIILNITFKVKLEFKDGS